MVVMDGDAAGRSVVMMLVVRPSSLLVCHNLHCHHHHPSIHQHDHIAQARLQKRQARPSPSLHTIATAITTTGMMMSRVIERVGADRGWEATTTTATIQQQLETAAASSSSSLSMLLLVVVVFAMSCNRSSRSTWKWLKR
jgi:hypothetical protein